MALAYAHNNFLPYSDDFSVQDPAEGSLLGQKRPYLAGRKNIRMYTAIPHMAINGTVARSEYGEGPEIKRIEGQGNGGVALELSDVDYEALFTKSLANSVNSAGDTISFGHADYPIIYEPSYKIGNGPLNVKVIDPLNVVDGEFTFKLIDVVHPGNDEDSLYINSANWVLTNTTTNTT